MTDDMILAVVLLAFALGAMTDCIIRHMVFRRHRA